MTEPDMSGYSAEERFKILVLQHRMGGAERKKGELWTLYGRGNMGGAHCANRLSIELIAEALKVARERHTNWLQVVVVHSSGGSMQNGDRQVVYRSSPEAKAWWE